LRKQQFSTRHATAQAPSLAPEQLLDQRQAFASSGEACRAPSQDSPANIIFQREEQVSPVGDSPRRAPKLINTAKAEHSPLKV